MKRDESGAYREVSTPKMVRRTDAMKFLRDNIDKADTGMTSGDEFMIVGNPTKVKASTETKITLTSTKKESK